MFRLRSADDDARPSVVGISQAMLQHYAEWARQFVRGGKIEKPKALVLAGYTPVQNASYFVLPITRTFHLYAVDRQLRTPDSRQSRFLSDAYQEQPGLAAWVLLPDPIYRFGDPSKMGTAMIETLQLDLETRDHFVLTGDVHHYQRSRRGRTLHVIAGGGGAFLHPARLAPGGLPHDAQWPNAAQCRRLLFGVAWKIGAGRSGFLPHLVLLALFFPAHLLRRALLRAARRDRRRADCDDPGARRDLCAHRRRSPEKSRSAVRLRHRVSHGAPARRRRPS